GRSLDNLSNLAAVTLDIGALEAGSIRSYTLDGGSPTAFTGATISLSGLTHGNHTVTVNQTDAAGNVSVTGSYTFAVDLQNPVAPTATLTSVSDTGTRGDNLSNQSTVTIDLTAATLEGSRLGVEYKLGTGNWTKVSPSDAQSFTLSGLTAGTHQVAMRQTDAAGNVSSEGTYAFNVDQTAPTLAPPVSSSIALLADGKTLVVRFSEAMDVTPETLQALVDSNRMYLTAGDLGYNVAVTGISFDAGRSVATLTLKDQLAGEVKAARLFYTDPSGDNTDDVLQDAAGNDLASLSFSGIQGRAVGTMGSTVLTGDIATGADYGIEVRVFNDGKVGGIGTDTLTYRGTGDEFLTGGAGSDDTVIVDQGGSSNDWYVTVFGKDSTLLPDYVRADGGQAVFAFTNADNTRNTVYAQAENINVGETGLTVTEAGVLSIDGAAGQTVRVSEMAFGSESSMQIGSGLGADTIIDRGDDNSRVDTVVYSQQVLGDALDTRDELLGEIENLITPTASNMLEVKIGNTVDSLQGVERLRFDVAGGSVDVAMIGTGSGSDGYDSLTSAASDKAATDVVYLVDRSLMAMDRSSVALRVESVVTTDLEGHLQVTWAGATASFVGTSKVVFATAQGPLTVWVVGAEGYNLRNEDGSINAQASLDAVVGQAQAGDVIYIAPDLLTAPLTYTVNTDGLVFLANALTASDATNQLTLNMGYSEGETPETSVLVQDLFLLGNANITVNGNQLANVIGGNRGDNKLYGFGGADLIDAGGGSDQVYGGAGNDVLIAQTGAGTTLPLSATLLHGGSGDDLLIAATTEGSRIDMTGGAGADTFKAAALSADNGALKLNVIVKDLNSQGGDDLDFTQIMKGANAATANDLAYSTPNGVATYTFANGAGFKSTATDIGTDGALTDSTVALTGTVKVEMSTTANVRAAVLVNGETGQDVADGRDVGSTAAADIYLQGSVAAALDPAANSNQGSIASELAYLVPLFEHNPLG
ncbi:MAG: Ig-like domain-containing protein, partial [Ramlibacter sp.]|uniref:beta strand repeat-containing protein n=1 Tax=Ramlibacter sp. TaxID=1917967 RepID=UPI002607D3AA